ncbi:hypothetical protein IPdc08_01541 [archaeon]|nr:hypothetical protein IPdc08_01541 [archaeon]
MYRKKSEMRSKFRLYFGVLFIVFGLFGFLKMFFSHRFLDFGILLDILSILVGVLFLVKYFNESKGGFKKNTPLKE